MAIWLRAASAAFFTAVLVGGCGSSEESSEGAAGGDGTGGSATGGSGATPSTGGSGGASTGGTSGSGGAPSTGGSSGSGGGPGQSVRFIAIGDCGKGDQGQLQVAEAVRQKCAASGCDFVQMLGDNFYQSGVTSVDDPQWQLKFEQPYANVTVPFWAVLGNHDYGGSGLGNEPWRADVQVAYSMKSNKWRMPARYYGHQLAHVDFFGLDTNSAMFDQHDKQKQDMSGWIGASSASWKIAFGHHPYRSNGPHGNAGSYEGLPFVPLVNGEGVKDLLDESVCGKADVYISAHDHSLQWLTEPCSGTELLISGGGASHTDIDSKNPVHYAAAKTGFLYIVIDGPSFTGEFYDANGQLEFARTFNKP